MNTKIKEFTFGLFRIQNLINLKSILPARKYTTCFEKGGLLLPNHFTKRTYKAVQVKISMLNVFSIKTLLKLK